VFGMRGSMNISTIGLSSSGIGAAGIILETSTSISGSPSTSSLRLESNVQIGLEPRIANTQPLLVKRRFHQNIKPVRLAWCQQNAPPHGVLTKEQESDVILTWRGLKVYDFQTCKSLGLQLDDEGLPTIQDSAGRRERLDRLAIVATTAKIQAQEKLNEEKRRMGIVEPPSPPAPEAERQFRLILRSKSYAEQKIRVKASTEVRQIIQAFRRQTGIPADKVPTIHFDGEPLDPCMLVKDTEIADLDGNDPIQLEVHVK